jgi:hypothetical protein
MSVADQSVIVVYQAVFLEFAVTDVQSLLRDYLAIASDRKHVVLSNNRHHQVETSLLTGYTPLYMPSLCRYTNASYIPGKAIPHIIQIARSRSSQPVSAAMLEAAYAEYNRADSCPNRLVFRDFAGFTTYTEFMDISAVLYFPYTVSLMSAFEFYGMNMPIFTPGLEFAVSLDMNNGGMSLRLGQEVIATNRVAPKFPPLPSNRSYEATRFWLNLSDFQQLPHLQHFADTSDLIRQLCFANFDHISEMMQKSNEGLMEKAIFFWKDHFSHVF